MIVFIKHALKRIRKRAGARKANQERYLMARVDSGQMVEAAAAPRADIRAEAQRIADKDADMWVTWDPADNLLYLWAAERSAVKLVTVQFPRHDGRWENRAREHNRQSKARKPYRRSGLAEVLWHQKSAWAMRGF